MSKIFDWVLGKLSVLLGALAAVFLALSIIFYVQVQNREVDIEQLNSKVTQLESDNKQLENKFKNGKLICEATETGKIVQDQLIGKAKDSTSTALDKLNNIGVKKNVQSVVKTNQTALDDLKTVVPSADDDSLDPDVISVLSAHCERVRGSPCENP